MPLNDSYGRLGVTAQRRWYTGATTGHNLLFIDPDLDGTTRIEAERLADLIRSVPSEVIAAVDTVAVRWLPGLCNEDLIGSFICAARRSLTRLESNAELGVIRFAPGFPFAWRLAGDDGVLGEEAVLKDELVVRCRNIEVTSLLAWGKAVWRPLGYHYRLPSGTHSDTFIRMADAMRSPRDAVALASWVLPDAADGLGVVADSASLTPLVVALHTLMRAAGLTPGRVAILESYPSNQLDTSKAVRDVAASGNPAAGLLSVHSTGNTRDRMHRALVSMADGSTSLHVVIDKEATDVEPTGTIESVKVLTWHAAGAASESKAETCHFCHSSDLARYVQIDPRSFGSMVLPAPDLVMPSVMYAGDNKEFWQLADKADAVELEGIPDLASAHPRHGADKRLSVKVNHTAMLDDDHWKGFAEASAARLAKLESDAIKEKPSTGTFGPYDVVVVDTTDERRENFRQYLTEALGERLAGKVVVFDPEAEQQFSDESVVRSAERLLVFRLGAVSGLSLQRTLVAVQDLGRQAGRSADVDAIVTHLRTMSLRREQTLDNSFATRLLPLWRSVLPEDRRSPLQDELDALSRVTADELAPEVLAYLDYRRAICDNPGMADPVLWCIDDVDAPHGRLSPHSYYGHNLRARTAYAAIGAAIHEARMHSEKAKGAPLWRQFEVAAIVRSYYDPIILACTFRWLGPSELWWGGTDLAAKNEVAEMIHRAADGSTLLVAELLVAASMGKLPPGAKEQIRAEASALLSAPNPPVEIIAGLALLDASEERGISL